MVLLVSIRAGGEGLNLTSSSVVVFLDEDWNPQVMRQAEARVHRIGQKHPVSIFKLYSRGTVEEQINRRLAKKAYLASMVTENYHQPFSNSFELVDANLLTSFARENVAFSDHNVQSQQIMSWKLETIIQKCRAHNNENRGAASPDGEKSWLERAERIRTNIFNGTTIDTTIRGFSIYKEQVGLSRAERRIGKKRVVMIEGFEVTKENLALSQMEDATSEGIDSTESISDDESEMAYDAVSTLCSSFETTLTIPAMFPLQKPRRKRMPSMPPSLSPKMPRTHLSLLRHGHTELPLSASLLLQLRTCGIPSRTTLILLSIMCQSVLRAVLGLAEDNVYW